MPRTATDLLPVNNQLARGPRKAATVTPNDNTDLTYVARALYLPTAGNVSVNLADDDDATITTYTNLPAGRFVVEARRVRATGTTVAGIIAEFG